MDEERDSAELSISQQLIRLTLLCGVVFGLAYSPQLIDPLVRHDDYFALFCEPAPYWHKTLAEGRWVTYLWHARPFSWPAEVNSLLSFLGWVLFSAATPLVVFRRDVNIGYKAALALFIAVAPANFLISVWLNTQVPAYWLLATYALILIRVPHRVALGLLFVFVPLALMSYTTHPFIMLALCLVSHRAPKHLRDIARTVVVFGSSLGFGLLCIYTMNYAYHDVFGMQLAEWRQSTPAASIGDYWHNLTKDRQIENVVYAFGQLSARVPAYGFAQLVLFAGAVAALFRTRRDLALSICAGGAVGIGLLLVQAATQGVIVPFRTTLWLWVLFGVAVTTLLAELEHTSKRAAIAIAMAVVGIIAVSGARAVNFYESGIVWNSATKELAAQVPDGTEHIYVWGTYQAIPGSGRAGIQNQRAIRMRLRYLTGAQTTTCDDQPDECLEVTPPFDPTETVERSRSASRAPDHFIQLPGGT